MLNRIKKYTLEIIVFICGMAVMVFELVGARVLAPFMGASIIVWSALIGVILACLSLGYWWGGRLADRQPDYKTFSMLIFGAALFVGLTAIFKLPILNFLQKIKDIRLGAVLASLVLFGPGSFFLAMVSPYAVRLKLANLKTTGATVGNLYALSTVGSILGTFLTGFVLLLYLGNTKILLLLAAALLLASILAFRQRWLKTKIGAVIVLIFCLAASGILDGLFLPKGVIVINSQYSDIFIARDIDTFSNPENGLGTGRPILKMYTDSEVTQSAMYLDNDNGVVYPYQKFFRLAGQFNPDLNKVLMLGGAAYAIPKDYFRNYPQGGMDVVEIDPKMTAAAKTYFDVPNNPRLTTYNQDARVFLNQNRKQYDAVFMDCFKTYIVPYQLTTQEAARKISNALTDKGIVVINLVSSIQGDKGKFFRAELATYKSVFPQVYTFRVNVPMPDAVQNLILVALKSKSPAPLTSTDPELSSYLAHIWDQPVANDVPILTDDYAPVDQYTLANFK